MLKREEQDACDAVRHCTDYSREMGGETSLFCLLVFLVKASLRFGK
jgi:hypothetical protein